MEQKSIRFTKMQGIGNDYIYINCFEEKINDPAALSIAMSPRHFSVGSDGLVLIGPSDVADAKMRIFNADGSEAQMCGNAIRCVGKYLYERGIVKKNTLTVETLCGIKILSLTIENGIVRSVSVNMGKAILNSKEHLRRKEHPAHQAGPLNLYVLSLRRKGTIVTPAKKQPIF